MNTILKKIQNIYGILIWITIVIFFCALLYIPNEIRAAESIAGTVNEIKILEIEPGDLFKLTFSNAKSIDPLKDNYTNKNIMPKSEESKVIVNGKETYITIDHITMPEFISKIDDIDGVYDVVVMGRENVESEGPNGWDKVNGLSSYRLKDQYNLKYRDYTNPFYEEINNVRVFNNSGLINGNSEKEYFSENDITKKRMKEIEKFIGKNQLIYMDKKIGRGEDYKQKINWKVEDKGITKTNLFSLYNEFGDDRVKKFDDLNINDIVTQYSNISEDYKRPKVYNEISPSGNADTPYELKNGKVTFGFTTNNIKKENLNIKIYIDGDGNGIFDENECKITNNFPCEIGENNYTKEYVVGEKFFGYLSWKIEVINDNGIETNITSSCIVKKTYDLDKKQEIKVLQIMTSKNYKTSASGVAPDQIGEPWFGEKDFKYNSEFKRLSEQAGYNMNVRVVSSAYVNENPDILKNYDTIIFKVWWSDPYEFSDEVVEDIKELISENKNIIFTRDSISTNLSQSGKPYKLTEKFRDYAGLARYKDPYRLENNKINENDIDGSKIPHNDTNDGIYSAGISTPRATTNIPSSTSAKKINSSKRTKFPFNLEKQTIVIGSGAHAQAFQLNLEDDDVVPLYNFSINGTEDGDSCNFYYAYSKGNITYCATLGDDNGNYTDDELKLFINVIVSKVTKNNNAPSMLSNQLTSGSLSSISYSNGKYNYNDYKNNIKLMSSNSTIKPLSISDGFNFITSINDSDNDLVKIKEIKINNETIDYNMIDKGIDLINNFKESNTEIGIIIPKSYLQTIKNSQNKKIAIKIIVEDENGATYEENYIIDLDSIISMKHGLYEGINHLVPIIEEGTFIFAKGATVNLGAFIDKATNGNAITLEFEEGINIDSAKIKVLNIDDGGLHELNNTGTIKNDIYTYTPSGLIETGSQILILYNEVLPKDEITGNMYTNVLKVPGMADRPATIIVGDELPDLF